MTIFLASRLIGIWLGLLLVLAVTPVGACAGELQKAKTLPKRIAYFEAGDYWEFSLLLTHVKTGLAEAGILDDVQFPDDLHISPGWGKDEKTYDEVAHRLMSDPAVDLILSMGTAATKALLAANNERTPIVAIDVADPVAAGFVDPETGAHAENLTIRNVKDKWHKVFLLMAKMLPVRKLGIMYHDSLEGLLYSNVYEAREVAREQGFELVEYPQLDKAESNASCYKGVKYLIDQGIDTFYIPALNCFSWKNGNPQVMINDLHANDIKTFARDGSVHVQRGALAGLSTLEYASLGTYFADRIGQNLSLLPAGKVVEEPLYHPKITLNLLTADELSVDIPMKLLISADEIFDTTLAPVKDVILAP